MDKNQVGRWWVYEFEVA